MEMQRPGDRWCLPKNGVQLPPFPSALTPAHRREDDLKHSLRPGNSCVVPQTRHGSTLPLRRWTGALAGLLLSLLPGLAPVLLPELDVSCLPISAHAQAAAAAPVVNGATTAHTPATADAPALPPYAWTRDLMLPFPSDLYTVPDHSTLTGKRVQLPDELFDQTFFDSLPFDGRTVLNRTETMDGFASGMPLLVAIPAKILPDALPDQRRMADPDAPVVLLDVETGHRLAYRTQLIERDDSDTPCTLLIIQPTVRLENRHRYLVVLQDKLRDAHGQVVPPPPLFRETLQNPFIRVKAPARYTPYMQELGRMLRTQHFDPSHVSLAFSFTVQSRESFYQPMQQLTGQIQHKATTVGYPLTHLRMHRRLFKGTDKAAYRGRGTFEILSFIDEEGRMRGEASPLDLDFLLEMPEECPVGGCPVAIFGHGLGATKETMFQVADAFAQQGIATIGVGAPWHGDFLQTRTVLWGSRNNLDLIHGAFLEHILRNVQLVELIKSDLAHRDMLPGTRRSPTHPDGHRLRADRILYIGQSMGGICGVATTALAPDIRAAVFDVAGGSTIDLLFESWIVHTMRIPFLKFGSLSAWENNRAMALGIYLFNDVDPLGFAANLTRDMLPGQPARLISQQAGVGDGLVPNWTTDKLAQALNLPVLRPASVARVKATEPDGPGLRYFQHSRNFFLAHLELMFPKSSSTAARFFEWSLKHLDEQPSPEEHAESTVTHVSLQP